MGLSLITPFPPMQEREEGQLAGVEVPVTFPVSLTFLCHLLYPPRGFKPPLLLTWMTLEPPPWSPCFHLGLTAPHIHFPLGGQGEPLTT